jgi:hypothetical protein
MAVLSLLPHIFLVRGRRRIAHEQPQSRIICTLGVVVAASGTCRSEPPGRRCFLRQFQRSVGHIWRQLARPSSRCRRQYRRLTRQVLHALPSLGQQHQGFVVRLGKLEHELGIQAL